MADHRTFAARLIPALVAVLVLLWGVPTHAVDPGEMLANPALEARAREIGKELRCLVCQNQSIDESDAPLARDLRVLVRERLTAGDSDADVINYVVSRYGDFVLLRPPFKPATYLLWFAPPITLALGGIMLVLYFRRRRTGSASPATSLSATPLSAEEEARVQELLGDHRP